MCREQFNTDHSSLMMELTIENFSLKAELLHGMGLTEVEVSLLETELLCIEEELVTCGNTSLDTSYQNVPRCAYTSIELHERKRWNLSIASFTAHSWTLRHSERYVADFYVSDLNSGTRVLVRAGNGAKVVSFVKPATTLHVSIKNIEQFPSLLRWLQNHTIPTDDLEMRFEEG
ncbi:hypothetical protein M5K25_026715 [Dendrobium thyrsiflorum]|uniref:Uncharacterized protein n=1 Tax=Dendrobium thyrsiflorum TaxID=117978 RepID=A0ABD0TYH4_DENTH